MRSAIIIFTKIPIPGMVKTRLSQNTCLSDSDSCRIAEAMLKDTISLSSKTKVDRIQIGYFLEEKLNNLNKIIEDVRTDGKIIKPVDLILQKGLNFDERFGSVIEESFKKSIEILIVLGADLPFLDPEIINNALDNLILNTDKKPIIIGPSSGGGLYLVGITKDFNPSWFSAYQLFSGGLELSQFANFSKVHNLFLISLPPYGDIDIEEDLVSLISYISILKKSNKSIGFYFPYYTAKIIEELKLYIIEEQDQTRKRKIARRNDD
jgi:glycosyltransferase A (GT-A) superfamily protein (DUF2064 family)